MTPESASKYYVTSAVHRIAILQRPTRRCAERLLSLERPVRLAQHFAREKREIGLTRLDDLIGLLRVRDHADCAGQDLGFFANRFGKRNLKARRDGNLCAFDQRAAGAIDQIDADGFEHARKLDRLWKI